MIDPDECPHTRVHRNLSSTCEECKDCGAKRFVTGFVTGFVWDLGTNEARVEMGPWQTPGQRVLDALRSRSTYEDLKQRVERLKRNDHG